MKTTHRQLARAKRSSKWQANADVSLQLLQACAPRPIERALELANDAAIRWERLRTGVGDADDWRYLAVVANVSQVRAEIIAPTQLLPLIEQAANALTTMQQRYERTGTWGACQAAQQSIPTLLELYAEIVRESTPLQMQQARDEVQRRTQRAHCGEIPA